MMDLKTFFEKNSRIAIAFSGGVDSSYLLYAAKKYGAEVKAYYVKTEFQPEFEFMDAARMAAELGAEMKVINRSILTESKICSNPSDRCYHCKRNILTLIIKAAHEDGFELVADGTNASDDASDRPGTRALYELSVCSPLKECGLTKDSIRKLSEEAGLFTWNKPSYSCLATRIVNNAPITAEKLCKIERAEDALRSMGFSDIRVRLYENKAGIEVPQSLFMTAAEKRAEIVHSLKRYFEKVFLDMEAR